MPKLRKVREDVKVAHDLYHENLNFNDDNSRKNKVVFARAAFMNVMLRKYTTTAVGEFYGLDHSTVCYHQKHHLLRTNWDDYMYYFDEAEAAFKYVSHPDRNPNRGHTAIQLALQQINAFKGPVVSLEAVQGLLLLLLEKEQKLIMSFGDQFASNTRVQRRYIETFKETF